MKVEISEFMEHVLRYADFDVEEIRLVMPELFTGAESIKITDCEDDWLEVLVDGRYYTVHATGDIRNGKIFDTGVTK